MNTIKIDALTYLIRTMQNANSLRRAIVETAHYDEKINKAMEEQLHKTKKDTKQTGFDIKDFNPDEIETLVDRKSNRFKDDLVVKVDNIEISTETKSKTKEKSIREK